MNPIVRLLFGIVALGCGVYSAKSFYEVSKSDISNRCWHVDKDGEHRKPVCSTSMSRGTAAGLGSIILFGNSTWGLRKEQSDDDQN